MGVIGGLNAARKALGSKQKSGRGGLEVGQPRMDANGHEFKPSRGLLEREGISFA
jgi:hypothetical protein